VRQEGDDRRGRLELARVVPEQQNFLWKCSFLCS
jgi:hypothetical protein